MKTKASLSIKIISAVIILSSVICGQGIDQKEVDSYLQNLPFSFPQLKVHSYAEKYFNIIEYGAVGNGIVKNTNAIAKAIEECSKSGGHVIIPAGLWLTGPIKLLSNVDLHLEKGALVVFSEDHADYPLLKTGTNSYEVMNPIYAEGAENISISGDGVFNGNGQTWRPIKKGKMTSSQWEELTRSGGFVSEKGDMYWPTEKAMNAEKLLASKKRSELTFEDYENLRDFLRPNLVNLSNCKNVFVSGVTFQNSPKFAFNPRKCVNVILSRVKILNEWWAQNGDGIDPSACKNVLIYQCTVNTGDDGICMKSSGKPEDSPALENVVIQDCIVYRAHGGFVIGSNTDGGMKNIFVNNCSLIGTDTGLRFKSGRDKGGKVENIYIQNIVMKDIAGEAIIFDLYYEDAGAVKTKDVNDKIKMPDFSNFHIKNLYCDGAKTAMLVNDVPEIAVKNISLENCIFKCRDGLKIIEASDLKIKNISILSMRAPVIEIKNSRNLFFDEIKTSVGLDSFMKIDGDKTTNINLAGTETKSFKNPFIFTKDELRNILKVN